MYNEFKVEKLTMKECIIRFDGVNRFLSNFYPYGATDEAMSGEIIPVKITFEELTYTSVEHAYQASKTLNKDERKEIQQARTANVAKKFGRQVTLRDNWEIIKEDVMLEFLRQKFSFPELREKLGATGRRELIEGNYWHDCYWGVCYCNKCLGVGQNKLGNQLMFIRDCHVKEEWL